MGSWQLDGDLNNLTEGFRMCQDHTIASRLRSYRITWEVACSKGFRELVVCKLVAGSEDL